MIEIDGALARLIDGRLEYQPRNDKGEVRWCVWYRDPFYDGWTGDSWWAVDIDGLRVHGKPSQTCRMEPEFDPNPIGWSPLQVGKAVVWASNKLDGTLQIALKYGAAAQ